MENLKDNIIIDQYSFEFLYRDKENSFYFRVIDSYLKEYIKQSVILPEDITTLCVLGYNLDKGLILGLFLDDKQYLESATTIAIDDCNKELADRIKKILSFHFIADMIEGWKV